MKVCEINQETCFIHDKARITRLTLLVGLPHSKIWREGNGFLYLSSLPLSLPLSLYSDHLECCSYFPENKDDGL